MPALARESIIKPGLFGVAVAADNRRVEFDYGNESLILSGVRPDVLFIGDSITHMWELQAYFGGTRKVLVNRGIGGDISTNVRRRFQADAIQLQPRVIVMKIGTNDLGWALEQLDDNLTGAICDNVAAMSAVARDAGIRMAVCSVLPIWGPSWYPASEFTARKNAQITNVNTRLCAIARETGAIYVDYHSAMVSPDGDLPRELADDGVHPHHGGYSIMAHVLRETLAAHGIEI